MDYAITSERRECCCSLSRVSSFVTTWRCEVMIRVDEHHSLYAANTSHSVVTSGDCCYARRKGQWYHLFDL